MKIFKKIIATAIAVTLSIGMNSVTYASTLDNTETTTISLTETDDTIKNTVLEENKIDEIQSETTLKKASTSNSKTTYVYKKSELKLLACLIQAEAGDQSYKGMVAVGNVVLNRVNSSSFPNTIKDVIYQKGQFAVVRNGSLDRMLRNYSSNPPKECIKAAKAAFAGENVAGDYLFFRMYSSSYANSLGSKSYMILGDHIFN